MKKSHYSSDQGKDIDVHYTFPFPLQGALSYLKIFRPLLLPAVGDPASAGGLD